MFAFITLDHTTFITSLHISYTSWAYKIRTYCQLKKKNAKLPLLSFLLAAAHFTVIFAFTAQGFCIAEGL
jgi:hypothetical protein